MTKCINAARDLLIKQDISSFELDIQAMRFDKTIYFDTFSGYAKATGIPLSSFDLIKDGCVIEKQEAYVVLFRKTASQRYRFTLAHELGHIHLDHSLDSEEEEWQANIFAGELLVPELVVLELQRLLSRRLTAAEVSRLFGISLTAAEVRLMKIHRKNQFSAYLSREILGKYQELINQYVNKKGKLCQVLLQS